MCGGVGMSTNMARERLKDRITLLLIRNKKESRAGDEEETPEEIKEIIDEIKARHPVSFKENELTPEDREKVSSEIRHNKKRVEERYLVNKGGGRPYFEYLEEVERL